MAAIGVGRSQAVAVPVVNGLRMTNIEAKFEPLAFSRNDWPAMPTVCSTPSVSPGDLLDLPHDGLRAFQRGRVGQLGVDEQIALVLVGHEPGRHLREAEVGQPQQAGVDQQRDGRAADAEPHQPLVDRRAGVEHAVEAAEEPAEAAVQQPREQVLLRPVRLAAGWRASAGLSVSELKAEISVAVAMVRANWR